MTQDITTACHLKSNPDISGTGVRVAFYVQAILTGILAYAPKADFNASFWSMNMTSFALFISAVSLHRMHQLSLYHAILVINLLYVHSFVAFTCVWPLYNSPQFRKRAMAAFSNTDVALMVEREWWRLSLRMLPLTVIAVVFGLIIWSRPATFGSQPECNSQTKFPFLGIPLQATGSGRIVGLVLVGLQSYTTVVSLVVSIVVLVMRVLYSNSSRKPAFLTDPAPHILLEGPASESEIKWSMTDPLHEHLNIHKDGSEDKLEPFLERWTMPATGSILVAIFLITAERTIAENAWLIEADSSDSAWTLGQIFPLVMLGVPVTSIIKISVRSYRSRRRNARRFAEMNKDPVVGLHVKDWHAHMSLEET